MTDSSLVDASPVVVRGTVLDSIASPADASTLTRVAVDEILKGGALPSPLSVRVPGYAGPGDALAVPGAPRFAPGERVLLFLEARRDGTFGIEQFMLGAFHEAERGGRRLALRELAGAVELNGAEESPAREVQGFADWIRDRARGRAHTADYLVADSPALRSVTADYTLLGHARWQVFDGGGSAAWEFQSGGWNGSGGGASAFATARAAWNDDASTPVEYTSAGTTSAVGPGLQSTDGHNRIIFGDPNGEISGSFDCSSGGVVAVGGYRTSGSHAYQGSSYGTISEGDIVTQDGIGCFISSHAGADDEIFAHELGHTLGIGHSSDPAALMYPSAVAPYGATLGADDRNALCFLYGPSCSAGPPPSAPAAPSQLVALATSSSAVHLSWNDNSSNETSFRIEARPSGGSFLDIGAASGNATGVNVTGLTPSSTYEFRVRARNAAGDSAYSNVAAATTPAGSSMPAAPSALQAIALSSTTIRLLWQDNAGNETEYRVERLIAGVFVDVGGVGANLSGADVSGLVPATAYTFRVKARNASGDSSPSNQASATTLAAAVTAPAAPSSLLAAATSPSTVHLAWSDNASNEDSYRIEAQTGAGGFAEVASAAANATSFDLSSLAPGTAFQFRVRARNGAGDSAYSNVAGADTPTLCGDGNPDVVCLNGGRFEVAIAWRTADGQQGVGHPMPLSGESAYFWFFLPTNIEMVVKLLDGCSLSQNYWVFATGLTNVETQLTVKDRVTGLVRTYSNPQGQPFQPLQDTAAFPVCGSVEAGAGEALRGLSVLGTAAAPVSAATCAPGGTDLCPQGGRFLVEAFWKTPSGATGRGQAVPLTADAGSFWFFDAGNTELVVKVLDACAFANRYWVFAGGLTNVEVRLRVTDTANGTVKEYLNPLNQAYLPLQDANAFATCP